MKRLLLLLLVPLLGMAQSDYDKAMQLLGQKRYAAAELLLEKHLALHPNESKATEYLGDAYGHQKKWDQAISCYKKLKIAFPDNSVYHYKYGGAMGMKAKSSSKLTALGMLTEIEQSFIKATKLDKKHIDSRWALVQYYLELPALVGGSEAKAQRYSRELLLISAVDGHLSQGYIDEYFRRYAKAEKSYLKAIEIGQSKTCYQKLADLYKNKMNSPEKAKQTLDLYHKKKT